MSGIEERLGELCAEHDVPGASVAVRADGRESYAVHGVLNRATGVETALDSPFMIQSITKVWTATLLMQLVEAGRIDLDRPVRTYLPDFRTADAEQSAAITSRHLLTHTGGFEGDLWQASGSGAAALELFVAGPVAQAPQYSRPGRMYSYCSAGFGVLGRLIEVMRGMAYPEAVRRFLADPLRIEEIAFDADEALRFRTAIGHVGHGERQRPVRRWALMPGSNPAAGNQLAMSARALLAFGRMHLADGMARDGTRVLSADAARAMREPQVDHPAAIGSPTRHGLGWWLPRRTGLVEHGGNVIGSDALLRMVPERDVAVAVLTNGGSGSAMAHALADQVLQDFAGIAPGSPLPVPDPKPVSDRYAGRYELRTSRADVTVENGRLWLTVEDRAEALEMTARAGDSREQQRYELRRVDGETFVLLSGDSPAQAAEFLELDPAGRPGFLHMGRAIPRVPN